MKKIIFTSKKIKFSSFCLGFLMVFFSFSLQSCRVLLPESEEFDASADAAYQIYSGNLYYLSSSDEEDLGFNLAYLMTFGPNDWGDNAGALSNPNLAKLYACNYQMLPLLENNLEKLESSKLIHEKTSNNFLKHLRFKGGIEFVQKNSKDGGSSITLNYIEVPTYALYFYDLPKTGRIFGGLGPYFAYGIGGKTKYSGGQSNSFDSVSGFKPFDAGLGLTAGYKMKNSFSFSLAYEIGFANISRSNNGDKVTNRGISLNVAYPVNLIFKKK